MKYGRTAHGKTWHMVVNGRALCFGSVKVFVETSDTPSHHDICENCDKNLRDKGKASRPTKTAPSKADYRPRHKFEDS